MKKISFVLSMVLLIIVFAGCSPTNNSGKNNKNNQADSSNIFRFAVMADCRGDDGGINSATIAKTLEEIKKISPQPSFAVIPGDLVLGADSLSEEKAQLQYFKNTVTKFYPAEFFYPGFGNHEGTAGLKGEQAFEEVFPEIKANFLDGYHHTVYYFDKANTRFYMLNSDHPGENHMISDTQLNWIKTNSDAGKANEIYFFHEPAYPTGAHLGSSLDSNKLQRDKLWQVVDSSSNPIVFCGHEHNYSRRHINSDFDETVSGQTFRFEKSVSQITVGTFGAPVYSQYKDKKNVDVPPIPKYHYAIVDINQSKIHVTVYDLDGNIIDQFDK